MKKIFTNVGKQCADCHADIHRRQFGANCEDCHTVNGWRVNVNSIRSHLNRFPLLGAHATLACDACHSGAATGVYTGLSTECISCHQRDFQQARPLDHVAGNLPVTCETCHSMDQWQGAKFDHAQFARFSLTGAHAQLACTACHSGNRFQGTPADCFGCHAQAFASTTDPPHAAVGFPHDCATCHTTSSWQGAKFDHNASTGFALTGAHLTVQCSACHVNGRLTGLSTACQGCHLTDYANTTNPSHRTLNLSLDCQTCHTTAGWQNAKFAHSLTTFQLTGAHVSVACAQCHVNGRFTGTPADCAGCHMADFNRTTNPNHQQSKFPTKCDSCHTTTSWAGSAFDHAMTGFALTGAHTALQCTQCHVNNNYTLSSAACVNCHLTAFNKTTNPNHKSSGFPTACEACHTTTSWAGAAFNHAGTGFALSGAHASLQCAQCHINNNYNLTSGACITCHLSDFNNTNNPPHPASGFPQDCTICHTTTNWTSATFNHSTTGFALTGAHVSLQCAQCHVGNNYRLTSGACITCHLNDFNSTTNPPHKSAGFPTTCDTCHTTANWTSATFNHSTTGFALTGAHVSLQCTQCHVNGNYSLTSGACINCHLSDFNKTNNPPHAASGFPQDCTICHTTANWTSATFNHTSTGFALTGAHVSLQCAQCHVNNNYALTSGACVNCHLSDFNGTTNPPHKSSGFPTTCDTCHTTTNWTSATFNHATTGFALTGAHVTLQCAQCHMNNNYALTSGACINCHLSDYNGTTNPPHQPAGFPQDCTICHTTTNWTSATFNHTTTGFALTGAHVSLQCSQCHVNNNYNLTSGACANCHMTDYNGTTNPPHAAAGFPTTCDTCHNTTSWSGATFDHSKTGWALTGAHVTTPCTSCHINGNYNLTSTLCYGCHQTDYQNTTNPNHAAAGFPTTCDTCHTTTSWSGAVFNHTYFPIYSGAHVQSVWVTCSACHTNASDYAVFSCINCHTHNKPTTDANHQGVKGYVYNSLNCYSCHPQGTAGG